MHPDTARQINEAWRNERRPARTIGARAHDAVRHAMQSRIKNAVGKDGVNIHHKGIGQDERKHFRPI